MKSQLPKDRQLHYWKLIGIFFLLLVAFALPFFLIEAFVFILLQPAEGSALAFAALWALLFSSLLLLLPRKASRIVFGICYYVLLIWAVAQAGYYQVFGKLMWLSTIAYAGEGATFLSDVLSAFPFLWWMGTAVMLVLGGLIIWKYPRTYPHFMFRLPYLATAVICILSISVMPELVFQKDNNIKYANTEYGQSSSYRATYNTMYDAKKVYNMCGIYHLTMRDIWMNEIYPRTPEYKEVQEEEESELDLYFQNRPEHQANEMTGIYEGKNVVLVLMESMDDWLFTEEETPTLLKLMDEGINFTRFYTPGYGSARTLNSEFCMNTGVYLPTSGSYVFDYIKNSYEQSLASQLCHNGYTAEVFHYNNGKFYSRSVLEPAIGYHIYNGFEDLDMELTKDQLYDEDLTFEIPEMKERFFRSGLKLNTMITRAAHLGYTYGEGLSVYALEQYPEYKGKYASEEEDCARAKAKLVDDFFARLLEELEAAGELENTVIIGMTDHYTYGYKNMEELMHHSGVTSQIMLEKTPCFIWSAEGPAMEVSKTLNTADLLPTVLNLMGIDSPYHYLGQDAFDPNYQGYAIFPDGCWVSNGIICLMEGVEPLILANENEVEITDALLEEMSTLGSEFIKMSNLLLTSDYYKEPAK